ncbi:2Fe-2S iron-sulfur cluster-binding protein [Paenibacillus daejeonensis]|uniref:2Fe-2S iron-sulfur cluster-binding protein n=1 Tax=Paenibacillus daejeonensis TaxID=135193 RepID=UPI00035C0A60|nr:2Fe-2S iron-sulfur cluster-binding protein [Paenibacillus daejeonensis]
MPNITLHQQNGTYEQEVQEGSNLVVLAGVKKLPHLKYGCGMGKCTKCTIRVIAGGESLQEPNWKEQKMLGERLEQGYRLACQLYITADLEFSQE